MAWACVQGFFRTIEQKLLKFFTYMQIYILTSHLKMRRACLSHFHISRITRTILFKLCHSEVFLSHREKTEAKAGAFKRRNCYTAARQQCVCGSPVSVQDFSQSQCEINSEAEPDG